ncbi:uncharacterized protein LOC132800603 [Ziziphus jujuba]|uniref:Uncharacterized protein LOC132800603 n=1 Tax=Ziziphus jujuba TaxID=326968 RepID=A0ABM4A1R1_ZIZJJ|nr:uncharacterized protein LOC132800603 [Ziziphus jujuba]
MEVDAWSMESSSPFTRDTKVDKDMQSLILLLKCLKIMGKDIQNYLLGIKGNKDRIFRGTCLSAIKILSGGNNETLLINSSKNYRAVNEEGSSLLSDFLLTAVKVAQIF